MGGAWPRQDRLLPSTVSAVARPLTVFTVSIRAIYNLIYLVSMHLVLRSVVILIQRSDTLFFFLELLGELKHLSTEVYSGNLKICKVKYLLCEIILNIEK